MVASTTDEVQYLPSVASVTEAAVLALFAFLDWIPFVPFAFPSGATVNVRLPRTILPCGLLPALDACALGRPLRGRASPGTWWFAIQRLALAY